MEEVALGKTKPIPVPDQFEDGLSGIAAVQEKTEIFRGLVKVFGIQPVQSG
jgi:hypothetical protein